MKTYEIYGTYLVFVHVCNLMNASHRQKNVHQNKKTRQ